MDSDELLLPGSKRLQSDETAYRSNNNNNSYNNTPATATATATANTNTNTSTTVAFTAAPPRIGVTGVCEMDMAASAKPSAMAPPPLSSPPLSSPSVSVDHVSFHCSIGNPLRFNSAGFVRKVYLKKSTSTSTSLP